MGSRKRYYRLMNPRESLIPGTNTWSQENDSVFPQRNPRLRKIVKEATFAIAMASQGTGKNWVFCLHICLCLTRPEEGIKSIFNCRGIVATDGCELPCGCWQLDLGPLQEQPVLLTTESSLQPHSLYP